MRKEGEEDGERKRQVRWGGRKKGGGREREAKRDERR